MNDWCHLVPCAPTCFSWFQANRILPFKCWRKLVHCPYKTIRLSLYSPTEKKNTTVFQCAALRTPTFCEISSTIGVGSDVLAEIVEGWVEMYSFILMLLTWKCLLLLKLLLPHIHLVETLPNSPSSYQPLLLLMWPVYPLQDISYNEECCSCMSYSAHRNLLSWGDFPAAWFGEIKFAPQAWDVFILCYLFIFFARCDDALLGRYPPVEQCSSMLPATSTS